MKKNKIYSIFYILKLIRILIFANHSLWNGFGKLSNSCILRIMGNGNSLSQENFENIDGVDYMVVNRQVLADNYIVIRPKYYVLADPHFFNHPEGLSILKAINDKTTWELFLFIPYDRYIGRRVKDIFDNLMIKIKYYNKISYPQCAPFSSFLYNHQYAMPVPQNVIVSCIMLGLKMNYGIVELYGVEHNWLSNLYVGDDNLVYLKNSHFYDQKEVRPKPQKEIQNIDEYPLYKNLLDYSRMFQSYWEIKQYLIEKCGSNRIINKTRGSFIDAFERG